MIRRVLTDVLEQLSEPRTVQPPAEVLRRTVGRPNRSLPASPRHEEATPVRPPAPEPEPRQDNRRQPLVATLSSRAGLRQALLLHEILGPPRSLRNQGDRGTHPGTDP